MNQRCPWSGRIVRALVSVAIAVPAAAPAMAGVVAGKVELPAPPVRPPPASKGYLERGENPYLPVADVDVTPYLVVVLEGGPATDVKGPAEVVWELRGDSFAQPLLAVRTGANVVLRNASRRPITVTTVEDPSILKNAVINPPSSKAFKAPAAGKVLTVIDPERAHVRGAVVGVASPFFAVPNRDGTFEISDVPAGKWTVRVWYRTGWLDRIDDSITVGTSKTDIKPKIPASYPIKGAAPAAGK